jgi:hypothetical protein
MAKAYLRKMPRYQQLATLRGSRGMPYNSLHRFVDNLAASA